MKQFDKVLTVKDYCQSVPCINPKVSVIIPAYNTEKYIAKCLISLISQTLKEIEIIVVDDGSTDSTSEIIKVFAAADSRVKVISQKNKKQGAARNRGMEIAVGEYIGFVDSDDWVDKDYYEKLYNAAKKYNSDLALAVNVRIGNGKTKKRLNISEETFVTSLQEKIDISGQVKNPCPTNKVYRREMLNANSIIWPEGVYCEDKLFTIKAVYYANGLVAVPDVYYYYYRNPNSTVNNKSKTLIRDRNNAKMAVLDFLKSNKAKIRDCDFWSIIKEINIFGVTLCRLEASFFTARVSVCGLKLFKFGIAGGKNE